MRLRQKMWNGKLRGFVVYAPHEGYAARVFGRSRARSCCHSARGVNPHHGCPIAALGQAALVRFSRLKLQSFSTTSLHNGNQMAAAPRELPVSSYALEVDGRLRAEFATKDGARAGGAELKKRFPMLQIRIYDAQTNAREEI